VGVGEMEAQRCEEKIASAQRDVLGRYDAALQELQVTMQKAADLEGALAVRAERQRVASTATLTEAHFVAEPKALRALQMQMATRMQELVAQLVQETVPRLAEIKRQLTVAGRLDEAVAIRTAIEKLQNNYLEVVHPDPGTVLSVDTILRAYGADRTRADAVYKNQKVLVRGTVVGFRLDPADARQYVVYLSPGAAATGWIQCGFSTADFRFREEKQFNSQFLVVTGKDIETPLRLQRGSAVDVAGTCAGWDEFVRLTRCQFQK
jgi:hypothetical protein